MGSSPETYNHPTISCRLLLEMARIDVDRSLKQNGSVDLLDPCPEVDFQRHK